MSSEFVRCLIDHYESRMLVIARYGSEWRLVRSALHRYKKILVAGSVDSD